MFDDHGVDDTDDGVAVLFGEGFDRGPGSDGTASVARIPSCRAEKRSAFRRRNFPPDGCVLINC